MKQTTELILIQLNMIDVQLMNLKVKVDRIRELIYEVSP